jgi:cysteine desulfurase
VIADASRVYLDYAATTPVDPRVTTAMAEALERYPGNPSSLYREGRAARQALEAARADVAVGIGAAHPDEVVFCGSGTESDNAAVMGIARAAVAAGRAPHVVISAFEHHAVLAAVEVLEREGYTVDRVSPDGDGMVPAEAVAAAVRDDTALVSVMHANNEVGTVQDVAAIARVAHRHGAYMHTDAAQSLGKVDINVAALSVDALSAAGHKIYAPKGTGILYLRSGVPFEPLLRGGGQEDGRRSGTESVAGAVAFREALRYMAEERPAESARLAALRDAIEAGLRESAASVVVHGGNGRRVPHLTNIGVPGVDGQMLLLHLDDAGFAVSTGSACSSGSAGGSHVLRAMGVRGADPYGALRVTVGRWTSGDDIERFVVAAASIIERLRAR